MCHGQGKIPYPPGKDIGPCNFCDATGRDPYEAGTCRICKGTAYIVRDAEAKKEPTGWAKVDRVMDSIINQLKSAKTEEEYQTVGFLCRECIISLAQAVYNPEIHISEDNARPSESDAYRMLEAHFSAEFPGSSNEALRRHAKAALVLANDLQQKELLNRR